MEEFRLQYPLDASSIVLDAGSFRGDFIDWCRKRWGCTVLAFAPSSGFRKNIEQRFAGDGRVRLFDYGLGAKTERIDLSIQGDSTTVYFDKSTKIESVLIRDVAEVFAELALNDVALFKINIEGGEYPLLVRMLDAGLVSRVRFFQVQYHSIGAGPEGPAVARDRIRERLSETHREEWCVNGGQWESWAAR
jgi:FkbM family methyltransferase